MILFVWKIRNHTLSLDTKHIFLYLPTNQLSILILENNFFCNIEKGNPMTITTKFKDGVFMPLENVKEVKEGDIVDIEIKSGKKFSWRGALKSINATSVDLQHNIKEIW